MRVRRFVDEDLTGAEFRESDLSRARLIGVVMQDAEIDGLVTNLVVNGVEVTGYVAAELDRLHPVRVLSRSDEPADLREAWRLLRADWTATVERVRSMPAGSEHESVDGEWSMVQTLRHLVFVHDSWFRRCVLGLTEPFTPLGMGMTGMSVPDLDAAAQPSLEEVLAVRDRQAAEVDAWLAEVTPEELARTAPVPDDDRWPPYARGKRVRQCLGTVLNEDWAHHSFCVRDLDKLSGRAGSSTPVPAGPVQADSGASRSSIGPVSGTRSGRAVASSGCRAGTSWSSAPASSAPRWRITPPGRALP